ncbi:bifunctional diaminohydroxyphosphoribosylaminopyrimidine deaminase/5-amino-6-(5-phosphoribosylamino)uracil reductase RibD [Olleya aquimaris]|uniref:Riboflavin biosynthesis protein RibD n=1 Tax=Olleya aquimaris TaxID=639310 RepID=A0A327RLL5_9FLAO|nr:bifunctional diaminohydroxyphosphoribosylaminopyrimidine deaminase/5-amino-6-(5-phosphoribosylamino)uracil reductase RibD [Olleya aquimaris]RAJ17105.1 diaminohydroxyphosphoribosylaminopyrimidine deaminase [Olleya aquimaris]
MSHEYYISRCLQVAKNGLGTTRPNPMVGCVIVHNNTIIAEGFTSPFGGNHAEVNAIQSVVDQSLLKTATIYVTLEPCSHYGKTPPCSDLIIKHQIPHVVIGCMDDNPEVAGQGIKKLKDSGCNVTVGVLEADCKAHHKRFFTFHNKKRPYIILKWAESSDGFIAPKTKNKQEPVWITNPYSRQLVHKWRAEEQAILVGTNTVIEDNPSLTVRDWTGHNPIRVVLDKHDALDTKYTVFNADAETVVLKESTAKLICDTLYKSNINSVIIEGGSKTLQLFINEGIWDEARVFTGLITFNAGIKAPVFSGKLVSEQHIKKDTLKIYTND